MALAEVIDGFAVRTAMERVRLPKHARWVSFAWHRGTVVGILAYGESYAQVVCADPNDAQRETAKALTKLGANG